MDTTIDHKLYSFKKVGIDLINGFISDHKTFSPQKYFSLNFHFLIGVYSTHIIVVGLCIYLSRIDKN